MESRALTQEQKQHFEQKIKMLSAWYTKGRRWWSFAYHTALTLSILFSGSAAVVLQLQGVSEGNFQKNLASILSGSAAAVLALSTAAGFSRKWQANRFSRTKIEKISNELMIREPTIDDVRHLNQIQEEHDKALIG